MVAPSAALLCLRYCLSPHHRLVETSAQYLGKYCASDAHGGLIAPSDCVVAAECVRLVQGVWPGEVLEQARVLQVVEIGPEMVPVCFLSLC